jgi:uncharacterized protein (DUF924 family)
MPSQDTEPEDILAFWFGSPTEGATPARSKLWFTKSADTDDLIRSRFLHVHEKARENGLTR